MNTKLPSCSLIIATYNWVEALNLVLKSVVSQTILPDEIIIADDGSTKETTEFIETLKKQVPVTLKHIWHEDKGFRLAEIRNKAIKQAKGDYIIQIDGDVILHKKFVEDHLVFAERGCFVRGSRVRLGSKISKNILKEEQTTISIFKGDIKNKFNGIRLPFLAKQLIYKKESPLKMLGCNMAFWKDDFVEANGYSNNLTGWGHEDSELIARFINIGLKKKILKHIAICYHIYHKENDRSLESSHNDVLRQIVEQKITRTKNGFDEV